MGQGEGVDKKGKIRGQGLGIELFVVCRIEVLFYGIIMRVVMIYGKCSFYIEFLRIIC